MKWNIRRKKTSLSKESIPESEFKKILNQIITSNDLFKNNPEELTNYSSLFSLETFLNLNNELSKEKLENLIEKYFQKLPSKLSNLKFLEYLVDKNYFERILLRLKYF